MAKSRRKTILAIKTQASIGAVESLTGTDAAFVAYDYSVNPQIESVRRPSPGDYGDLPSELGGYGGQFSFEVELYESAPWATTLFTAMGFDSSGSPENNTSNWSVFTIGEFRDGNIHRLRDCMCTLTFQFRSGQPTRVRVEGMGIYVAPTTAALPSRPFPLGNNVAPRFANAVISLGGITPKISECDIAIGNTITLLEDGSTAGGDAGLYRAWISDREMTVTLDPEELATGTYNPGALMLSKTQASLGIAYAGMEIEVPAMQVIDVQNADRNGVLTNTVTYRIVAATGGDITIDI